jgi:hypothetical protein
MVMNRTFLREVPTVNRWILLKYATMIIIAVLLYFLSSLDYGSEFVNMSVICVFNYVGRCVVILNIVLLLFRLFFTFNVYHTISHFVTDKIWINYCNYFT